MTPDEHFMSQTPIPFPSPVRQDVRLVRDSGLTNMFDVETVTSILRILGKDFTAAWISKNRGLYGASIFVDMAETTCAD